MIKYYIIVYILVVLVPYSVMMCLCIYCIILLSFNIYILTECVCVCVCRQRSQTPIDPRWPLLIFVFIQSDRRQFVSRLEPSRCSFPRSPVFDAPPLSVPREHPPDQPVFDIKQARQCVYVVCVYIKVYIYIYIILVYPTSVCFRTRLLSESFKF